MLNLQRQLSKLVLLFYVLLVDGREYRFDYKYNQDIDGWVKIHRIPVKWDEARIRCHAEGAVLASPLNELLLKVMKNLMAVNNITRCGIYTGIHASFHKGVYTSLEGVPLSKITVSWAPDEPDNNEDSENCLMLLPNGNMADVNCSEVLPYVCYRKKTKEVVQSPCGTTDSKYNLELRTGSCYKFHHVCQTWRDAYMTCEAEGGYLAIINSHTEALALKDLYAKNSKNNIHCKYKDSISVGFLDWSENQIWFTIHGETLEEAGYAVWAKDQPAGTKLGTQSQRCGAMLSSGLLNDIWCDVVPFPFFCEKSPDSLLDDE